MGVECGLPTVAELTLAEGVRQRLWACEVSLIDVGPGAGAPWSFVPCQELDALIRLLDITDTSHGAPSSGAQAAPLRALQQGWRRGARRRGARGEMAADESKLGKRLRGERSRLPRWRETQKGNSCCKAPEVWTGKQSENEKPCLRQAECGGGASTRTRSEVNGEEFPTERVVYVCVWGGGVKECVSR